MPSRVVYRILIASLLCAASGHAISQVDPVRSSLQTRSVIGLSVVDLWDEAVQNDDQGSTPRRSGRTTRR